MIKCERVSLIPPPELSPPNEYKIDSVTDDYLSFVKNMKAKGKTICLFFGDLRPSKGINEVLRLCESNTGEVAFLICGQDIFDILSDKSACNDHVLISPRRQSDEELAFLFSSSDIILLPYQSSSQSGVLEVARAFGKPILCSPILAEAMNTYEFASMTCDFSQSPSCVIDIIQEFSEVMCAR